MAVVSSCREVLG